MPHGEQRVRVISWWGDVWQRFCQRRLAVVAGIILVLVVLAIFLAPWIAPYDYSEQFRREGWRGGPIPPNTRFWLGTDNLARDLLSRLLWGGRASLIVGFAASTIATLIGLFFGVISGYFGGGLDFALMRFVDVMMSIPSFFLMLLLTTILEPGLWVVVFVIAAFSWTYPTRVFRAQAMSVRQQEYIVAAHAVGVPEWRILLVHILPQVLSLVIVYVALGVPLAMFAEVGLSYLGLGVPKPTPSWGVIAQEGTAYIRSAPWISMFATIAIMLVVVCVNLVGNAMREAMDPAMRGR